MWYWVQGKSARKPRVMTKLATLFVCSRRSVIMQEMVDSIEMLCDEVETVNRFYLEGKPNAGGSCEAAVTARLRIGWGRFGKCGELLLVYGGFLR